MFAAKLGIVGNVGIVGNCVSFKNDLCLSNSHPSSPEGLWTGLLISVLLQSVFLIVLLVKLDWEKASQEVRNEDLSDTQGIFKVTVHTK